MFFFAWIKSTGVFLLPKKWDNLIQPQRSCKQSVVAPCLQSHHTGRGGLKVPPLKIHPLKSLGRRGNHYRKPWSDQVDHVDPRYKKSGIIEIAVTLEILKYIEITSYRIDNSRLFSSTWWVCLKPGYTPYSETHVLKPRRSKTYRLMFQELAEYVSMSQVSNTYIIWYNIV